MNDAGVTPRDLRQQWQYAIEIDGFEAAYFTTADLPKVEFDTTEFNPAGSMFPQKAAGRASFPDLTFEKGVPQDNPETNILDWINQCITVTAGTGGRPNDYMRNIDIVEYSRDAQEQRRFALFGAWVQNADFGSRDGSSSDNAIESMTICYQYFEEV